MALSEAARQALKGQAQELIDEIRKIEQPIERLIAEREALQKQIDEIKSGSRDLKEAVNVLMNLIGEEKPYGEPKANDPAPAAADYESPGSGRAERRCPKCESTDLAQLGMGTQRVEEELQRHFPDASIVRMDLDTTGRKHAHQKILGRFGRGDADILCRRRVEHANRKRGAGDREARRTGRDERAA